MSAFNSRSRIFLRQIPLRMVTAAVCIGAMATLSAAARAQGSATAYTDHIAYNAGSTVQLNVQFPPSMASLPSAVDLAATVRYAGETAPVVSQVSLVKNFTVPESARSIGYRALWKVPSDAAAGRYLVDLVITNGQTHEVVSTLQGAASFAVYRKLVKIERIELDKTYYKPGDAVACRISVKNLTEHALSGLRVEFSDRYWPWIGNPAPSTVHAVPLDKSLSLAANAEQELASASAAVAPEAKETVFHQYAVVVWDHERKNIYDIAFSPLTFVQPPGAAAEPSYPGQFTYSQLADMNTTNYRQFLPPELNSAAIQFNHAHTMFPTGGQAVVLFTISNSTDTPWRGVSVITRWLDKNGKEVARNLSDKPFDLIPGADPLPWTSTFRLPERAGLYRARVQIINSFAQVLAMNDMEVAANPLPRSILIFCAHEDDEGGWSGLIRAAVENNIPLHFVYFTSGDAGSCDRYYQHSCNPSEALRFGSVRMSETRSTLAHLGVPSENIFFLGLPDGGSGQIWYDHLDANQPYLSVLLATDHSPYAEAVSSNLPYARRPVVEVVKAYVKEFQPEVIVTAHPPNQGHIDHIVNNYFVVKGLQELLREKAISPDVKLLVDRIYDPKSVPQTPYQYDERDFFVTGDAAALAQESWWYYQSQGGNRAQGNLRDFDKLPRSQPHRVVLDWKDHEGWNEKRAASGSPGQ
jgi:LmbE family N-acetylglucosaminyl deacetylase